MIPILYESIVEGTVPSDYGIGPLTDCLACEVKENRNGSYELTLSYAAQGIHASEIVPNAIIKAKPNFTDNPQLFRIYKVGKTMNGRFEVNAQHISYDLSGKLILTGTATTATSACTLLELAAGSFTIQTDKNVTAPFEITEPSSVRSWFGGKAGSLLDVYGTAEWKYDNFICSLLQNRGADRGVQIRYGKNLTSLSQDIEINNLASAILPYYYNSDSGIKVIGNKITTGIALDILKEVAIDFTNDVDTESDMPIADQLDILAQRYLENNNLTQALSNIKLDFAQEGTLLDRVDLCDTVHIFYEALGIAVSSKCIATTWDVLKDRYTSCTFGDTKTNITDTIAKTVKKVDEAPTKSYLQQALDHATELISGNLGGYVVLHDSNGDGAPDELLIMNTNDINTATKVWRWNQSGLGYSNQGYNPAKFEVAITSEGEIVADFIKTGTMSADLIRGGVLQLGSNLNQSGTLQVLDESNTVIAQLDKDGLRMNGADGFYIKINPVDGFSGYDAQDNRLFWVDEDEFHMKKSVIEEEITLCGKMRFVPVEIYDANDNLVNDGIGLVSVV